MRYSARDRVVTILSQGLTQKQAAKLLGVSERTIRRWKNEGVKPLSTNDHKLSLVSSRIRKRERRHGAPNLPVIPPTQRRKLREYQNGKWTGKYKWSDWLTHDVRKFSNDDIFTLLQVLRDQKATVQFLVKVVVRGDSGRISRTFHYRSKIYYLGNYTDIDLWELIDELITVYEDEAYIELVDVLNPRAIKKKG